MGDTPTEQPSRLAPPDPAEGDTSSLACATCGAALVASSTSGPCPECLAAGSKPAESLTSTVGRGARWLMLGSALSKIAALVAQVVLGTVLTDVEFGVFATAASIGWFVSIMREGGTSIILMQRGAVAYPKLSGALFWLGTLTSFVCGLIIAGIALKMSLEPSEHPEISWILYIIAISTPLHTIGGQLQTKLRQDMRFAKYSQIQLTSAVLRQVVQVVLALMGFGAMSFAWPYLVCALYEDVAAYRATREKVWKRSPDFHLWGGFLKEGWWSMVGLASNFALDQGSYLIMGQLLAKNITGQFYFAFQLTAQTGVILGFAVQQVLVPALVRLNPFPERQAEAALRSLRVMTYIGSIVCVGVSVCISPLRAIIWPNKWEDTVPAIIILGIFYAWRVQFGITTALLQAKAQFKRYALLTLFEGSGVMVVTLIAVLSPDPDVTSISWWVGGWLMVGRIAVTLFVFRTFGIAPGRVLHAVGSSWILAVIAGALARGVDWGFGLEARLLGINASVVSSLGITDPAHWMVSVPAQLVRLAIIGSACLTTYLLLTRALLRDQLLDALSMVPGRIRTIAARSLGVHAPAPAQQP